MDLVVDANILFSFFKKDSFNRDLIRKSTDAGYVLASPDFVLTELIKDEKHISEYCEIGKLKFKFLLLLLESKIEILSQSEYEGYISKAGELAPHPKDMPYFALALKLSCPIWSNEKAFKQQSEVKVYDTKEIKELFG